MPTSDSYRIPLLPPTLLLAVLSQALSAQIIQPRQPSLSDQWTFGFSFFGGIPLGEFKGHENGGGGGEGAVGFQPFGGQPLVFRLSGGGMQYGSVKATGYQEVCDESNPFDCWTEEVEYNARSHSMWHAQFGPEIMATGGTWRPFAFAQAGLTWFNSRTNLKPTTPSGTESSQNLFWSNNFSTAYGAGIRRVFSSDGRQLGFELSTRVTRNAEASYLNEDGIQRQPDGTYTMSPRHGAANVLGIHIGLWVGPRVLWSER